MRLGSEIQSAVKEMMMRKLDRWSMMELNNLLIPKWLEVNSERIVKRKI